MYFESYHNTLWIILGTVYYYRDVTYSQVDNQHTKDKLSIIFYVSYPNINVLLMSQISVSCIIHLESPIQIHHLFDMT